MVNGFRCNGKFVVLEDLIHKYIKKYSQMCLNNGTPKIANFQVKKNGILMI